MTCNATASRLHKINIVNLDQTSHDGYGALAIPTVLSNATNTNQNAANPTESDAYTSILAGLEQVGPCARVAQAWRLMPRVRGGQQRGVGPPNAG